MLLSSTALPKGGVGVSCTLLYTVYIIYTPPYKVLEHLFVSLGRVLLVLF